MNDQPMQNPKPAVSKWLWITLIIVAVLGAGFFAWFYLMGPGKEVATSTSTTTTPTANKKTTDTSDWKTVKNTKYGYEITLTDEWKNYRWEEVPGPDGATETITYYLPTTDTTYAENGDLGGRYVAIFNIVVFTPEQWEKADQTKNKYINKNEKYVFAYTTETIGPSDLRDKDLKVTEIIKTFKFTDTQKTDVSTAKWETTTSEPVTGGLAFGFSVKTQEGWKKFSENDTSHGVVFFTDNMKCDPTLDQTTLQYSNDGSCFDDLAIAISGALGTNSVSKLTEHNMVVRTFPAGNSTAHVGVSSSMAEVDRNTIFDSFKVTE